MYDAVLGLGQRYMDWNRILSRWALLGKLLQEEEVLPHVADWLLDTYERCRDVPVLEISSAEDWALL